MVQDYNGAEDFYVQKGDLRIGIVGERAVFVHWAPGASTGRELPEFLKTALPGSEKISLIFDIHDNIVGICIRDLQLTGK